MSKDTSSNYQYEYPNLLTKCRRKIRKYTSYTRAGILSSLQFRLALIVLTFGNLLYLTIVYYLWRAIFASSPVSEINGMDFPHTLIYVVLATALFNFMEMYAVWEMGRNIQSGLIVLNLLRPMEYQRALFWSFTGDLTVQFITTFLPTFLVVSIVTHGTIPFGANLLLFLIAVILAVIINFNIDFFVGTICLFTESIWGINITKQVVVLLLSGATIPVAFFPEALQRATDFMPFASIYNTPLVILMGTCENVTSTPSASSSAIHQLLVSLGGAHSEALRLIGVQLIWVLILSIVTRLFWKFSVRRITVNGG